MGTCVLVLGLHRGGTSCTAGVLHRLGVDMNPTSGSLPGNTHEDKELQLLHEEAVGHWTTPVVDFERIEKRYTKVIREREKKKLWGFKDPRLNFLLPWVLEVIRCNVKVVSVYRDPVLAAKSIVCTNPGMSFEEAKCISAAYSEARHNIMQLALAGHMVYPLHYNGLIDHPEENIRRMAAFLGVSVKQEAVEFVDPELRHFK